MTDPAPPSEPVLVDVIVDAIRRAQRYDSGHAGTAGRVLRALEDAGALRGATPPLAPGPAPARTPVHAFSTVAVDLIVDVSTAAREVAIGTDDPAFVRSLLADARTALDHLDRIAR